MKLVLLIAAFVTFAVATQTRTLKDDFKEFFALIPHDKIMRIAEKHLKSDAEFQKVVIYLQGPEWAKLVETIKAKPQTQALHHFMLEAGIDMDKVLQYIHNIIAGAKPGAPSINNERTMREFFDEVEKVIPKTELLVLLNYKMNTSTEFKAFFDQISSEDSHIAFEEVRNLPEVQYILSKLKEMNLDVQKVIDLIYQLFNWK